IVEMLSWRDTIVRIEHDEVLRNFIGAGFVGKFPNSSYLCGANKFIKEKTWKKIIDLLLQDAINKQEVTGEKLRVDTTLCETNVYYPTDSHLLWDCFRALVGNIRYFKEEFPYLCLEFRFHDRKAKKLFTYIGRNSNKKDKKARRKIRKNYNLLMDQVMRACEVAECCMAMAPDNMKSVAAEKLKHYLPIAKKVLHQADMRINQDIKLEAKEKIYSVFEEHTELIKRGKAGKPMEFGHMVMIAQTEEKFISDYKVMEVKKPDKDLVSPLIENHKQKFGAYPEYLAGDKGFHESPEKTLEFEKDIKMVCIPKKGMRTEVQALKEHSDEFKEMQSFRAGVEGSISTLKRAFGMKRCLLRSYKTFAANIGCIAFCYNLVLLSKM
ncbi:transposase, partial [Fibrobacterota bacterium]